MKTIQEIVKSSLEFNSLRYVEDDNVVLFNYSGENCKMEVRIICEEDEKVMIVIGLSDLYVPTDRQDAVLELINKFNDKYVYSTLCLNPSNGNVICRSACNTDDGALTENIVMLTLASVLEMMDEAYLPMVAARLGAYAGLTQSDEDSE